MKDRESSTGLTALPGAACRGSCSHCKESKVKTMPVAFENSTPKKHDETGKQTFSGKGACDKAFKLETSSPRMVYSAEGNLMLTGKDEQSSVVRSRVQRSTSG